MADDIVLRRSYPTLIEALAFISATADAAPAAPFTVQLLGGSAAFPDRTRRYRVTITTALPERSAAPATER